MTRKMMWALGGALVLCSATHAFAAQLKVGRVKGQPGQSVIVPVTYDGSGRVAMTALSTDIHYRPEVLSNPRCAAGADLNASGADKTVQCSEPQPGLLRLVVFGLNQNAMPTGEVATVTFDVAADARPRKLQLRSKPSGADAAGNDRPVRRRNGSVRVASN